MRTQHLEILAFDPFVAITFPPHDKHTDDDDDFDEEEDGRHDYTHHHCSGIRGAAEFPLDCTQP